MTEDPGHGTVQRYWQGCRCLPCRAESAAYSRGRRKHGPTVKVKTSKVRAYLALLARHGIGRRQVAALTGLDQGFLWRVKHRQRTQIRQTTAARILACPLVPAGGTVTTSWWAKKYVDALRSEGYTDARIERWIGCDPVRLMSRSHVRTATAVRAERVYRDISGDADPTDSCRLST